MRNTVISALLACLISAPLLGQRVVRRVAPPPEEELRFDSNDLPLSTLPLSQSADFNFSPNIIFSPDSRRGFVPFPGRSEADGDRVMAFDVETGEVLALIEVGPNPFFLTLAPDGTRLAVASIFLSDNTPRSENGFTPMHLGSIAVIDIQDFSVRRLDFDDVGFSVFNNVVFSADGKTGFVASAGTDEIIRFDVDTMTERGPRIKVEGGSRPASLTMAHSGTFFTVVLPGSSALPIEEVPDSIQIVDTASFKIVDSIVPEPLEIPVSGGDPVKVAHNFFGANTVSISGDDRYAIIGDRENSSGSFIPELASDHALIIDLEEGTVIERFGVGGATGASQVSPDGRFFTLITAVDILFYDTESMQAVRASSGNSQFRESSRPAFSVDSTRVFVASPILDLLNVYDVESAVLTHSIPIGQEYERNDFQIPAGPQHVSVAPDGETMAVVIFNGNQVEILKNTFRLTSPQLIAENIDSFDPRDGSDPEPIPAEKRFFSGLAVSNYGEDETRVILTASGFLQNQVSVSGFFLTADPNPIQVCEVGAKGKTTLTWDVTDTATMVQIRSGSEDGPVVASGEETGTFDTGETVENGTTFFLINTVTGETLDTVTVNHTELGCPAPFMVISPSTIQVCDGSGVGRTTVFWDTRGITDEPEIRLDSATGPLFAKIGPSSSQQTGRWVTEGMSFFLVDGTDGKVLDEDVVHLTDRGCPLALTRVLQPDQQLSLTADPFLASNSTLNQDQNQINFDGWVDLNSDLDTLSGIFLTYDGALNRMDGGPISAKPAQVTIFPEIQVGNNLSTVIEVTNPSLSATSVLFDLFDSSGELVATSLQTVVGTDQRSFPILGDPNDNNSVGIFDSFTGLNLIQAFPNPIQVCGTDTTGKTEIFWDTTGFAEKVEIRVGAPDGDVFVTGEEATGSKETDENIADGTVFFLLNATTGEVLDQTTVRHNELGCPAPYLDATPNPVRVCDGGPFGLTTLQWDATEKAEMVEVRVGSATGQVLADGGATGFATTGRWVTDGMEFFLINKADSSTLDTETVHIIREGCPLAEFSEGYLRMATPGTVSFETFGTEDRMSVLPAQPSSNEFMHYVIPHFAIFGSSETILTVLNPSDIPLAGIVPDTPDDEEPEPPEEPIHATLTLRADDGSALAPPLMLELHDGVMRKGSIPELFELQDTGVPLTGWIDVETDQPNLVGSVEIRIFGGQAGSSVALQPVDGTDFVFSHVAEGFGFGTGLAAVNPNPVAAEVTIELRNQDGDLLGIEEFQLGPGERRLGLVSEIFPGAGDLLGGTLRIRSDQPLGNLELFFTLNEKILSAVPATRVQ